jgi:hypothetical protein
MINGWVMISVIFSRGWTARGEQTGMSGRSSVGVMAGVTVAVGVAGSFVSVGDGAMVGEADGRAVKVGSGVGSGWGAEHPARVKRNIPMIKIKAC